ncbi:hypothetical protein G6F63_015325 [Rhizopus arrhizus]|nr:hypothetical protein G6F63_015325 [Rhizopus arrhizus]
MHWPPAATTCSTRQPRRSRLGHTWAGEIGFAAGAEWRREKLDSNNPWQIDAGLQVRPAIAEVHGQRQVSAAYAEVNVPLASTLELSAAAPRPALAAAGRPAGACLGVEGLPRAVAVGELQQHQHRLRQRGGSA